MPSGSINQGRITPQTPGPILPIRDRRERYSRISTGTPARTAIRTRRHRTHHAQLIPTNPQAHVPNRIARTGFGASRAVALTTGRVLKGSLTSSIAKETLEAVGTFRHSI